MAYIVESFTGDRGIQLGNEELIRPFSFGTNWQRVRVGVRYAVYGISNLPAGVQLRLGLCTGKLASLTTSCVDAIWIVLSQQHGLTWSGTNPNYYYDPTATGTTYLNQRTGSTNTNVGNLSAMRSCYSANPTALRSVQFFDVVKAIGSNNVTVASSNLSNAQVTTDWTQAAFYTGMCSDQTPTGTTNQSLAAALTPRSVKDWDTAFVCWVRDTPACCIYDFSVCRQL